ncbi:MAG: hypothetical protein ABI662_09215 [Dermatophilaceae bacterium]
MRKPVTVVMGGLRGRFTQFVMSRRHTSNGAADDSTVEAPAQETAPMQNPGPSIAFLDGGMVARSRILVSGSSVTLTGTLTNETGYYMYFSGMPPYAVTIDLDGNRTVLSGDFSSPPREQPSSGDCVMHPWASIPYRSLPVRLQNTGTRWEGTDWCVSTRSTALDSRFYSQQEAVTIQLFD